MATKMKLTKEQIEKIREKCTHHHYSHMSGVNEVYVPVLDEVKFAEELIKANG